MSFAGYNTSEGCDRFIQAISEIVAHAIEHYLSDYSQDKITDV